MHVLLILLLTLTFLHTDEFRRLNSSPTQEMLENLKKAQECKAPFEAKENFDSDFRYGCFCGKGYPSLTSDTNKSFRDLDRDEKDALIAKYYLIKPIDSIDEVCMKHDICYIYEGRKDQLCNDALYNELRVISDKFYEQYQKERNNSQAMRCQRLASDIGVVFKTIFGSGDNLSMMRLGMFMMINTPMTIMSKGIQRSSHLMNDAPLYPLPNERCSL